MCVVRTLYDYSDDQFSKNFIVGVDIGSEIEKLCTFWRVWLSLFTTIMEGECQGD